jgi:hypothetical protein
MNEDTKQQTVPRPRHQTLNVDGWKTWVHSRPRIRQKVVDGYYVTIGRVYPRRYTGDKHRVRRYHIETDDRETAEAEAMGLHYGRLVLGLKYEKRYL